MTTRKIREAEAEVAAARLALRTAELALARAEADVPVEPTRQGTTLRFKVQYRAGEQTYTYVALKVTNGWLLSGKRFQGRTASWEDVVAVADKNVRGRAHFEDLGV